MRTRAYVCITTSEPRTVVQAIRQIPGVARADARFGTPDAIAIVDAGDLAAMDAVIDRIAGVPEVAATDSKVARWIESLFGFQPPPRAVQSASGRPPAAPPSEVTAMPAGVGRFQVMATLQAARAKVMGLPLVTAKSWGLNKAIFFAAAKRGFIGGRPGPTPPAAREVKQEERAKVKSSLAEFHLGEDKSYSVKVGGTTLFTMGGEIQTPEAFERQIEQRFSGTFRQAWSEALEIIKGYDREVLASPTRFYDQVYKPRRDELAKKWNDRAKEHRPARAGRR